MQYRFPKLNLPEFTCKIKKLDGKEYIFDEIRKKYLVLTPEEWVRQHLVHLLITQYGFSKNLIRLEGGHTYNKMAKRSDILVYDNTLRPFLLVECKAPEITINQEVTKQILIYNKTIQSPYLCVSNGMKTFCFSVNAETNQLVQMPDFPKSDS